MPEDEMAPVVATEPEDAGDHEVPIELVVIHEILEWEAAVAEREAAH